MRNSVLAVGVVIAFTIAAGCSGDRGAAPTLQRSVSDSAEQVIRGMRHIMVDSGVRQAQLFADTAFVFEATTRFELEGVRLITYDSLGFQTATITAKSASYSTARKNVEARGDVIVTTTDGKRLNTQHLLYDQQSNRIRSDSAFNLVEPDRTVTGASFESDTKLGNMRCTGNCTFVGRTPVKEDGSPGPSPDMRDGAAQVRIPGLVN